jgi:hypothetical protein
MEASMHTDPQTCANRPRYVPLVNFVDVAGVDTSAKWAARTGSSFVAEKLPTQPCPISEDPDFKLLERAIGALIVFFVIYMATQFVRAWLEGHL